MVQAVKTGAYMKLNVQKAKARLSKKIVDVGMPGEGVVIAKAGKRKPKAGKPDIKPPPRRPGAAKTKAALTAAFFEPMPEAELRRWEA